MMSRTNQVDDWIVVAVFLILLAIIVLVVGAV